jgi:hypothetical protein
MIHLLVAKKVNPNASLAFFVGNIAPDANQDGDARSDKKIKSHFYDVPDRDDAFREFALKAHNDYLKGYLLHLFADKQFHIFWKKNVNFTYQFGEESWTQFMEENDKINSYAYQNAEWAYSLYKQMENWDYDGFVETESISKDDVKWMIPYRHERTMTNKLAFSTVFPPALVEKLVDETAEEFSKWFPKLSFS